MGLGADLGKRDIGATSASIKPPTEKSGRVDVLYCICFVDLDDMAHPHLFHHSHRKSASIV